MSQFRTIVEVPALPWRTGYPLKNMFLGSCFTENIGGIMKSLEFNTDVNPFGIIYNPVSIARGIERLIRGKAFTMQELFSHNGLWHSFMHHGRFSDKDPGVALNCINQRLLQSSQYLHEADFLILTLGTAWIYEYRETGEVVANCHKVPSKQFRRFRLTTGEVVDALKPVLETLFQVNPGIKVIFTVSPIRHTSDGAVENQLSKATLLLAADALVRGFGPGHCAYFPSYELVMDELRDYRFYAADMVHLSDVAVQFIWEKFANAFTDLESQAVMDRIEAINRAIAHKPFNPETPEHLRFLENTMMKLLALSDEFSYISLSVQKETLIRETEAIRAALAAR